LNKADTPGDREMSRNKAGLCSNGRDTISTSTVMSRGRGYAPMETMRDKKTSGNEF